MLKIAFEHINKAKSAKNVGDLENLLQSAMQLEHATIPPYLTAAYSLKRGPNTQVISVLKDIAEEEMQHMAMVANVINAIGGRPNIAGEAFIPKYPGSLPLTIGGDLIVGLEKFSLDLVQTVFMEIEKPNQPVDVPVDEEEVDAVTIGDFYETIIQKIQDFGDAIFTGDPNRQVVIDQDTDWQVLQPITDVGSAVKALNWIIEDGEGSTKEPFDGEGELAHYYRFGEVFHRKKLIPDDTAPTGYSYSGDAVNFDPSQVWDLDKNPKATDYPEGSQAREAVEYYNQLYSDMLRSLQRVFDGEPEQMMECLGIMTRLRTIAVQIVQIPSPLTGKKVGFSYEYRPPNPVV